MRKQNYESNKSKNIPHTEKKKGKEKINPIIFKGRNYHDCRRKKNENHSGHLAMATKSSFVFTEKKDTG